MQTQSIERRLGDKMRDVLPVAVAELVMFILKQAWACLFGGLFLIAIIATRLIWGPDWPMARYDALFAFAVTTQVLMLVFRLETTAEAKVIILFHLTGTAMELFKVHVGSWSYPETAVFKIGGVPLFSGFMYAAIGSYIARVIRVFDMRFAPAPPYWCLAALAGLIYLNFFSHHFFPDIRIALFVASIMLFGRTRVWFHIGDRARWMPLPLAAFLTALAVFVAENVGTVTQTWTYAGQAQFDIVPWGKLGSWYLLLFVSFATVLFVMRDTWTRSPLRVASETGLLSPSPDKKDIT